MTHNEQKAQEWFEEWKQQLFPFIKGEVYYSLDSAISFAAFCLDKSDSYWKTRCLLGEKYAAATPVDLERFESSSAPHHRDVYNEFLTLNASKGENK
jgi:hypothetical protein